MSASTSVKQVALITVAKDTPKKRCKNEVEAGVKRPKEEKYKQVSTKRAKKIRKARGQKPIRYKKAKADVENQSNTITMRVLSRREKCRIMCGVDSFATLLLIFASSGGNAYLYYYYSGELMNTQREHVWIFLVLTFLSLFLSLTLSFITLVAIFKEQQIEPEARSTITNRARSLTRQISRVSEKKIPFTHAALLKLWNKYRSISDVNGRYYILKMHISEAMESLILLYNYVTHMH